MSIGHLFMLFDDCIVQYSSICGETWCHSIREIVAIVLLMRNTTEIVEPSFAVQKLARKPPAGPGLAQN